ncbi:unnamed protein product [Cylicostephanus goldi]|uniref:Uncharacterized protein n=1 Tax=Cylicostephanus goldi TaxID=71465 RepID=A0A3P7PQ69_CYLGO|nr:unnamed protein product [Cylicostephanus goldi]
MDICTRLIEKIHYCAYQFPEHLNSSSFTGYVNRKGRVGNAQIHGILTTDVINRYGIILDRCQEDCFLGETCDRGFCCPIPRPLIGLQSEAPRIIPQPAAHDKPTAMTGNSDNNVDELCPDGSPWTKRCRQEEDCDMNKEVCAEGKCCAKYHSMKLYLTVSTASQHLNE